MSAKKIEGIIGDIIETFNKRDIEKSLSLFTEDGTWVTPEGIFKGKEELKRYLMWVFRRSSEITVMGNETKILVQGNRAVRGSTFGGIWAGKKWESLIVLTFEFSDGKIQHLRSLYDRVSIAKQIATRCGKILVPYLTRQAEKGLR